MADPKPRLALVDRAIQEQPEDTAAKNEALRRVLTKHTPTIAKLVRADVTNELLRKVGAGTIEEISSLPHLRASFEREEAKHVKAGYWAGAAQWGVLCGLGGLVCGAALSLWLAGGYGNIAFQHAQEATQQGALVGAAAANQDPANRGHDTPHLQNAPAP